MRNRFLSLPPPTTTSSSRVGVLLVHCVSFEKACACLKGVREISPHVHTCTHVKRSGMRALVHVHHSAHPRTGEPSFSSRRCSVTLPLLTPSGRCGINGPFAWRHRPMYTAKETYLYGKRDLLTPAFAHASSAPPACARARVRVRMCMCSCVHMCVCVCVCVRLC